MGLRVKGAEVIVGRETSVGRVRESEVISTRLLG